MYTDRKNDRLKNREKRVKNITKRTILKYRKTTFKVKIIKGKFFIKTFRP